MELHHTQHGGTMTTSMSTSGISIIHYLWLFVFELSWSTWDLDFLKEINVDWKLRIFSYGHSFAICCCRKADCFKMGWPMRTDADFFVPAETSSNAVCSVFSLLDSFHISFGNYKETPCYSLLFFGLSFALFLPEVNWCYSCIMSEECVLGLKILNYAYLN
jgi:hypothetical protein